MGLMLREADLARLDHALTTILSPLVHDDCDEWRVAVESSVIELLDGDHVVFGVPRAGVAMHIHATNVAALPQRAIQTLFGACRICRPTSGCARPNASGSAPARRCGAGFARSGERRPASRRHAGARHFSAKSSRPVGCTTARTSTGPSPADTSRCASRTTTPADPCDRDERGPRDAGRRAAQAPASRAQARRDDAARPRPGHGDAAHPGAIRADPTRSADCAAPRAARHQPGDRRRARREPAYRATSRGAHLREARRRFPPLHCRAARAT